MYWICFIVKHASVGLVFESKYKEYVKLLACGGNCFVKPTLNGASHCFIIWDGIQIILDSCLVPRFLVKKKRKKKSRMSLLVMNCPSIRMHCI